MNLTARFFLVLSLLLAGACSTDEVRLPGLAETVKRKIAAGDMTPISLSQATEFSWDRVFIFKPYTPYEDVLMTIGNSWEGVEQTGIATRDDAVLLAFMQSGEVTAFTMYPRRDGDLSEVRARGGLTPDQALFVARRVDRGGTVLELPDGQGQEEKSEGEE